MWPALLFCAITPFSNNARSISSNDLEWDGESKRIIAVGDGKEKWVVICVALRGPKGLTGGMWNALFSRFGHAFMFDSGSSTGEILGHSKVPSFLGACMCVS